ncbi:MAG TPA: 6-hydroxymethylpterin diphosphokinase MptE-like protein [Tepidisphaeraceae bacterium]|nr:6-hydroxymethylpterin diphosphokinase MptE-like protein [Tepidisphaeraceae bacterium]
MSESSRFVLPPDAPYLANLEALWTADADLAAAIEAVSTSEPYPVEPSRAGPPTLALAAVDESGGQAGQGARRIYLHSRYAPLEEAARMVDSAGVESCLAFYVFGFGLGYHVQNLFDRAGDEAIFLIFEPDLMILRTAFEHHDFSKLIASGRAHFFHRLDKGELLARLTPHIVLIHVGAANLVHGPSQQLAGPFHDQMRKWISEYDSFASTSLNTLLLNSTRTAENISRNIGWYAASPGIARLRDRHKGEPAIIVSAGPSLRKNKHLLPGLQGKAVLIAVQTTLQPLVDSGVEPDYVTSLDYSLLSTRFWQKLPRTLKTELVAEPKAAAEIFHMNPGPLSILGNDFAEGLLREMKLARPTIPSGATVAHLAFYLAEHMGCDPIIFIGQDLGFSDGLCYTAGTSYDDVWRPELSRFCTLEMKQWEQIVRERFILRSIPDYQGRGMYTEERLFTYLQQFERDFMKSRSRIIDATEGGAFKRGTRIMTLADAAAEFCQRPLPSKIADHPGLRFDRLDDCIDCLRRRRGEAAEIERLTAATLPLLAEIRDHLDDQPRVNRAICAIDGLRARMNELGACYDLVTQLTQNTELQRFEADRRISASRAQGADRQRQQVDRDILNVRGVQQAAVEFQQLMDATIAELQDRPESRSLAA